VMPIRFPALFYRGSGCFGAAVHAVHVAIISLPKPQKVPSFDFPGPADVIAALVGEGNACSS